MYVHILQENLKKLQSIENPYNNWSDVKQIIASIKPVITKYFPENIEPFNEISQPKWVYMPSFDGLDENAQIFDSSEDSSDSEFNVDIANDSKKELISFIESLINLSGSLTNKTNHNREKSIKTVSELFNRFHTFVRQLRNRHANRPSIDVNDEYDVQDLLHALLKIHFNDVRPEEYSPSYAGGNSRIDFILKKEKIAIEVKKTRKGLEDKKVGEEILIDISRYRAHTDLKTLICCIYDPEGRIVNPSGLTNDIQAASDSNIEVIFIINPK